MSSFVAIDLGACQQSQVSLPSSQSQSQARSLAQSQEPLNSASHVVGPGKMGEAFRQIFRATVSTKTDAVVKRELTEAIVNEMKKANSASPANRDLTVMFAECITKSLRRLLANEAEVDESTEEDDLSASGDDADEGAGDRKQSWRRRPLTTLELANRIETGDWTPAQRFELRQELVERVLTTMGEASTVAFGERVLCCLAETLYESMSRSTSLVYQSAAEQDEDEHVSGKHLDAKHSQPKRAEKGGSAVRVALKDAEPKSRAKRPVDPNCPKAPNAYQLFGKDEPSRRSEWKTLSRQVRAPYEARARLLRQKRKEYLDSKAAAAEHASAASEESSSSSSSLSAASSAAASSD
jgi:hypothetical protein